MNNQDDYHKYHKMTLSYAEADKYISLGWTIQDIKKVTLRGTNKVYDECKLIWKLPGEPVTPNDSN